MRRHNSFDHALCLIFLLALLVSLFPASVIAQSGVPERPAISPPQTANPPAIDSSKDSEPLPWQPGLGRPIVNPATVPPRAIPIPSARPILNHPSPTAQTNIPQGFAAGSQLPAEAKSVLIDFSRTDLAPVTTQTNTQTNSQPGPYPVIPAALVQSTLAANASQPNRSQTQTQTVAPVQSGNQPRGNQPSNPNLVDANITTVTRGMNVLPNDAGQVWRTYDISPYTRMVQSNPQPEQAIVDWILKETGKEIWFTQPMGILSASRDKLYVYHTSEIHRRIKPIIDRFVYSRGKSHVMGMRLVTIASPNWRSTAFSMMQPVEVNSAGVEAWLMSKESAAILANMLRNRADYQEHSVGDLSVVGGQKYVLSRTRPVNFVRSIGYVNDAGVGRYQPINKKIDEGYTVNFSALNSLDGRSVEAIIGCNIDQIEKMQPVSVELPIAGGQKQSVELMIPQVVSWQLNERFRWPSDQVLLLSCGVVATPGPQRQALFGLPSILNGSRRRADALMFLEYKGPAVPLTRNALNNGPTLPNIPQR